MATPKPSTNTESNNTVEAKAKYFMPEFGTTVEATSAEEAAKLVAQPQPQTNEGGDERDQMNGTSDR